ncbi:MAG: HEAT repeat domain-containing protein [Planctomycetes bacterium]|nr:HEAT repeat domain-containing protein [Planctomycetota bacterium]MCB9885729.1 HEAT repeat domain-containing protein [Planctomycetota bacterium]
MSFAFPLATAAVALSTFATAQHGQAAQDPSGALKIAAASNEGQEQIKSFELAPGLVCDLVAAEPDVCNIVAFSIDGKGRVYVAETFRINDGVFDTRSYMQWKDDDLACLTVADRIAKYEKYISKDIPKYAAFPERVRMLVDTDRNGTLDRSTVFATGFTDLADGIGSGVLPVGDDVFFTNIPKLWRLRDTDDDGVADERHVVHDGYGVHTSLIGHDLHGLIVGPDRRLYFSIGDRGFHVEQEGKTFAYPHEGAVLRCELDGSDLEVVHHGLRNPQELAFDQWGDLFTGDNNSDGGDRARFVPIVPGADSGWRIGYQWLSDRGAWNREKMWHPRHPGQPAWIMPPIMNFADGPSGLVYDPGVGLPDRYRDCFFLCDFRGGRSYSGVHALRVQRQGAGFELVSVQKPIWSILATDVDFAPDGSLYVSDWVSGWNKTGKGRIYRVRTPQMANDMALRNGAALLASDLTKRPTTQLRSLLAHPDRRVRQAAQFALVDLDARDVLTAALSDPDSRLARLHGIWGLGILGRKDPGALAPIPALLGDGDADVRAMAARVLGDARVASAGRQLVKALDDGNGRVQKEAALALARLGENAPKNAGKELVELLRQNDDRDHVLRHAAVFALASIGAQQVLHDRRADPSPAVRRGVLLALIHLRDPIVAEFLTDTDATLRQEAARGIYGEPIDAAMPALAQLATDDHPDLEPIDWRALNANRMLGAVENGETLVHVATSKAHPTKTRVEAIAILAEWPQPHGQDRVFGNWRPCTHPGADRVAASFAAAVPQLLQDPEVAERAAEAVGELKLAGCGQHLAALVGDKQAKVEARVAALDALDALRAAELVATVEAIPADAPVPLRKRAVALLSRSAPAKAVPVLASLLDNAPVGERQAAFAALGDMKDPAAAAVLRTWLERLQQKQVEPALQLDLVEAAAKQGDPKLTELLAALEGAGDAADPMRAYAACLEGGDPKQGRKIFFDNEATRCTRCHTLGGNGGNAGPVLDGIGKRQPRAYLLESLVAPSAKIAEGFGSTTIHLHDGGLLVGFVSKDQDGMLTIVDTTGAAQEVAWNRIAKREASSTSAMPPMAGALNHRQLRDLVAFLANQK